MNLRLTRTLKMLGLAALTLGAVVAMPQASEAAPRRSSSYRTPTYRSRYARPVYRHGNWYTIRGQRLQYRNGYWYNTRGQRRWDLDRDGVPNHRDRDRDGDGIRNSRDRHPNTRSRR